jgi:hypothetical protein
MEGFDPEQTRLLQRMCVEAGGIKPSFDRIDSKGKTFFTMLDFIKFTRDTYDLSPMTTLKLFRLIDKMEQTRVYFQDWDFLF